MNKPTTEPNGHLGDAREDHEEPWAWEQEVRAGLEPWRHPLNWLGSAIVIAIAVAIGITIWPGWDRVLALSSP
ncbi:hypothetical protein JI739_16305 [Ramlibacter sp. AW1]|uniref:Uncharacterized protein n=1 Tax=Ramlibacter aurantiacus TaxID=2801330 RepID=A0A937D7D7_9BURK|nr:hypothetical protein [Ramlibacter aurantiacus]MBL0421913.1 hypothetical protein [Ramlibacter aurantiacus]